MQCSKGSEQPEAVQLGDENPSTHLTPNLDFVVDLLVEMDVRVLSFPIITSPPKKPDLPASRLISPSQCGGVPCRRHSPFLGLRWLAISCIAPKARNVCVDRYQFSNFEELLCKLT